MRLLDYLEGIAFFRILIGIKLCCPRLDLLLDELRNALENRALVVVQYEDLIQVTSPWIFIDWRRAICSACRPRCQRAVKVLRLCLDD